MKVISLGSCCEVTTMLKYLEVFSGACPFDYLTCYDISDVISLLNARFENIKDTEIRENFWNYNNLQLCVKNTNIFVPHYTPTEFEARMKRRIERFFTFVSSGEKILFVRKSHLINPLSKEQIEELKNALSKYTTNFELLVINEFCDPSSVFEVSLPNVIYRTVSSTNFTRMNEHPFCIYYCDPKEREKQFWTTLKPHFLE